MGSRPLIKVNLPPSNSITEALPNVFKNTVKLIRYMYSLFCYQSSINYKLYRCLIILILEKYSLFVTFHEISTHKKLVNMNSELHIY